jgi:hypothetical protein
MHQDSTISRFLTVRLLISLFPLFMAIATAKADFVSTTPGLPVIGVPLTSTTGVGCFAAAGVCATPGTLTLDSVVSMTFNPSGQDIVSNATYLGALTDLANNLIGPVTLTGTVEEEVLGRTASTQTGTWTNDLISLSLDGPVLGNTLTLGLDLSKTSSGTTSIMPLADGTFRINSFFDVFVEITLDRTPPLTVDRGPLELVLSPVAAVPEFSTWAMMILGFAGVGFMVYRRKSSQRKDERVRPSQPAPKKKQPQRRRWIPAEAALSSRGLCPGMAGLLSKIVKNSGLFRFGKADFAQYPFGGTGDR